MLSKKICGPGGGGGGGSLKQVYYFILLSAYVEVDLSLVSERICAVNAALENSVSIFTFTFCMTEDVHQHNYLLVIQVQVLFVTYTIIQRVYNQQWNVSQVRSMDSAYIIEYNTRKYT